MDPSFQIKPRMVTYFLHVSHYNFKNQVETWSSDTTLVNLTSRVRSSTHHLNNKQLALQFGRTTYLLKRRPIYPVSMVFVASTVEQVDTKVVTDVENSKVLAFCYSKVTTRTCLVHVLVVDKVFE